MKKTGLAIVLTITLLMASACERETSANITADEIWAEMKETAAFSQQGEENLLNRETAERYGISTKSIKEGKIYFDANKNAADKVIIATAAEASDVEKIEKALSSEKIRLVDALENDKEQQQKVKSIVVKTIGRYCVLIMSEDAATLEKIFDRTVSLH